MFWAWQIVSNFNIAQCIRDIRQAFMLASLHENSSRIDGPLFGDVTMRYIVNEPHKTPEELMI